MNPTECACRIAVKVNQLMALADRWKSASATASGSKSGDGEVTG